MIDKFSSNTQKKLVKIQYSSANQLNSHTHMHNSQQKRRLSIDTPASKLICFATILKLAIH